jgi:YfiH family protein
LIPWQLDRYRVVFTTRLGGVSEGPYASLNLGRKSGDDVERVDENRRIACEAIGADTEELALNFQVHSARVIRAAPRKRGEHADGLWTDEPGLPILAMSADCLPIVLARADGAEPAVCVLHAGWKGLLAGIVAAGTRALGGGGLAAAIGPGIGPCCYEVGEEVAAPYRERFGADILHESRLDLWTSAERALRSAGVERIDRFDRCTACEPETFFSHRRDRGRTGRQGVIAYVAG